MKKLTTLLLVSAFTLSLAGCGDKFKEGDEAIVHLPSSSFTQNIFARAKVKKQEGDTVTTFIDFNMGNHIAENAPQEYASKIAPGKTVALPLSAVYTIDEMKEQDLAYRKVLFEIDMIMKNGNVLSVDEASLTDTKAYIANYGNADLALASDIMLSMNGYSNTADSAENIQNLTALANRLSDLIYASKREYWNEDLAGFYKNELIKQQKPMYAHFFAHKNDLREITSYTETSLSYFLTTVYTSRLINGRIPQFRYDRVSPEFYVSYKGLQAAMYRLYNVKADGSPYTLAEAQQYVIDYDRDELLKDWQRSGRFQTEEPLKETKARYESIDALYKAKFNQPLLTDELKSLLVVTIPEEVTRKKAEGWYCKLDSYFGKWSCMPPIPK